MRANVWCYREEQDATEYAMGIGGSPWWLSY